MPAEWGRSSLDLGAILSPKKKNTVTCAPHQTSARWEEQRLGTGLGALHVAVQPCGLLTQPVLVASPIKWVLPGLTPRPAGSRRAEAQATREGQRGEARARWDLGKVQGEWGGPGWSPLPQAQHLRNKREGPGSHGGPRGHPPSLAWPGPASWNGPLGTPGGWLRSQRRAYVWTTREAPEVWHFETLAQR